MKEGDHILFEQYYSTILNTIGVEKNFYSFYGKNQLDYFFFPRPDKWITKYRPNLYLFKIFWDFIGLYLFILLQFLRYFTKKKVEKKVVFESDKPVLLEFGYKSKSLAKQLLDIDYVIVNFKSKAFTRNEISINQLYSIKDLLLSLTISFRAFRYFKKFSLKYSFQFYTMFEWFLTRRLLDRINADFIITNHTDRWAVCADQSQNHKQNRYLILIQHGIISLSNSVSYNLVYKLKKVRDLYVYDLESFNFFKKEILENYSVVKYFKPIIDLTKMGDRDKIKILIVGHPLCNDKHLELAKFINQNFQRIELFYKPHPTVDIDKGIRNMGWTVIENKTTFPEVNILLSYESTLVEEYKNLGVDSIVHGFDNTDDLEIIKDQLTIFLKKLPIENL